MARRIRERVRKPFRRMDDDAPLATLHTTWGVFLAFVSGLPFRMLREGLRPTGELRGAKGGLIVTDPASGYDLQLVIVGGVGVLICAWLGIAFMRSLWGSRLSAARKVAASIPPILVAAVLALLV